MAHQVWAAWHAPDLADAPAIRLTIMAFELVWRFADTVGTVYHWYLLYYLMIWTGRPFLTIEADIPSAKIAAELL